MKREMSLYEEHHVAEHRFSSDTWLAKRTAVEPSRSPPSASTASCSRWRTSFGGLSANREERQNNNWHEWLVGVRPL